MRRAFAPRGGVSRQDVLVAADADSWEVYRKTKKQSRRKRKEEKGSRMGKDKVEGDRLTLNGFNRRTGARNR